MLLDWKAVYGWISAFSAVFGIIGTIFGIWSFYETRESRQISFASANTVVYSQPKNFAPILRFDDHEIPANTSLSETIVVLWNSGTKVFRQEDIRSPISLTFGGGHRIIAVRVLDSKSSVADNFNIRIEEGSAQSIVFLMFKIFDPKMAVKIAIFHEASGETLAVNGDIGPQVDFREASRTSQLYTLLISSVGILSIGVFSFFAGYFDNAKGTRRFGIAVLIYGIAIVIFGFFYAPRMIASITGAEPPISVSLSREGLPRSSR
jgi:hypothetical protein